MIPQSYLLFVKSKKSFATVLSLSIEKPLLNANRFYEVEENSAFLPERRGNMYNAVPVLLLIVPSLFK